MISEKVLEFKKEGGAIHCICGESGKGKSTMAREFLKETPDAVVLDGDLIRHFINSDLGYSFEDRKENNERIAKIAEMLCFMGKTVVISTVRADLAYERLLSRGIKNLSLKKL